MKAHAVMVQLDDGLSGFSRSGKRARCNKLAAAFDLGRSAADDARYAGVVIGQKRKILRQLHTRQVNHDRSESFDAHRTAVVGRN
ncbi:MAG: hypothetical protein AAF711_11385 [Planctomycetota bacterium]